MSKHILLVDLCTIRMNFFKKNRKKLLLLIESKYRESTYYAIFLLGSGSIQTTPSLNSDWILAEMLTSASLMTITDQVAAYLLK